MTPRTKTDTIVIHCSATPKDMDVDAAKIKHWHTVDNGWDDIGYHYVIKRDGTLEVGREEHRTGSHARQVNGTSLGICMIGGSDGNGGWENNFLPEQFDTLKQIIETLKDKNLFIEVEKIKYPVEILTKPLNNKDFRRS